MFGSERTRCRLWPLCALNVWSFFFPGLSSFDKILLLRAIPAKNLLIPK